MKQSMSTGQAEHGYIGTFSPSFGNSGGAFIGLNERLDMSTLHGGKCAPFIVNRYKFTFAKMNLPSLIAHLRPKNETTKT